MLVVEGEQFTSEFDKIKYEKEENTKIIFVSPPLWRGIEN